MNKAWWKESVIYQIYPRSFCDSNGDGVGDLPGILQKLDYLQQLGVDVLWLNPVYRSPGVDNGYDISDYRDINPEYGTMADMEHLIAEARRRGIRIILNEARRLATMVEELLEFSRISDGRFTLSVEPMDLKAELEDAVYTYREFFRRKGLKLEYIECEEEFPPISGDPERLRQVFCNLLDNADKHGGSGGEVDVSIHPEGNMVAIRVRDFGPGVPEEELPYVKYKFYKGSSKARGSGIGLAVCEEIVTCHGGTLDIENAMGGGCVVTLRLPMTLE